jgi:hypothetical protein
MWVNLPNLDANEHTPFVLLTVDDRDRLSAYVAAAIGRHEDAGDAIWSRTVDASESEPNQRAAVDDVVEHVRATLYELLMIA